MHKHTHTPPPESIRRRIALTRRMPQDERALRAYSAISNPQRCASHMHTACALSSQLVSCEIWHGTKIVWRVSTQLSWYEVETEADGEGETNRGAKNNAGASSSVDSRCVSCVAAFLFFHLKPWSPLHHKTQMQGRKYTHPSRSSASSLLLKYHLRPGLASMNASFFHHTHLSHELWNMCQ